MTVAHDLFAETNPAFCAYAVYRFSSAYASVHRRRTDLPLAYLALPLALSADLAGTFEKTNRNTGLREWFERNPEVQVGIHERVNACLSIITEAIRFGCFAGILEMDEDARIAPVASAVRKSAVNVLDEDSRASLKRAERLGVWFATAGSTKVVFDVVGMSI